MDRVKNWKWDWTLVLLFCVLSLSNNLTLTEEETGSQRPRDPCSSMSRAQLQEPRPDCQTDHYRLTLSIFTGIIFTLSVTLKCSGKKKTSAKCAICLLFKNTLLFFFGWLHIRGQHGFIWKVLSFSCSFSPFTSQPHPVTGCFYLNTLLLPLWSPEETCDQISLFCAHNVPEHSPDLI